MNSKIHRVYFLRYPPDEDGRPRVYIGMTGKTVLERVKKHEETARHGGNGALGVRRMASCGVPVIEYGILAEFRGEDSKREARAREDVEILSARENREVVLLNARIPGPRICSMPGCVSHVSAKGLCSSHHWKEIGRFRDRRPPRQFWTIPALTCP